MIRISRWFYAAAMMSFGIIFVGGLIPAHAQQASPTAVITWRAAASFVSPSYMGKALPNSASSITASVLVFDGGSAADVSNDTIYWYLNGTLLGGGPGVQSFTFTPFVGGGGSETLKVEIPDYASGLVIGTTPILISSPTVVLDAPYSAATFSANPLVVSADPYFFAVASADQLSYAWSVNGQTVSGAENPGTLQVSLGPGTTAGSSFDVSLSVANAADSTTATDEKILTYQPLP